MNIFLSESTYYVPGRVVGRDQPKMCGPPQLLKIYGPELIYVLIYTRSGKAVTWLHTYVMYIVHKYILTRK